MDTQEKLNKLNQVLEHCQASAFYRDRLPAQPLGSLEELKSIPLTTKEDLRNQSPFGLLCVPQQEIYQYHESFGTTGTPVSVWLTREDFAIFTNQLVRWGVNFNQQDIVLVRFPYAISAIAHATHAAAQAKDACVIPASSRSTISPFPRVIHLMQNLRVTVLAGLPLQMILLAETAELLGLNPRQDFPHLRALCTAGEALSGGRRRYLEELWGVPVFDNYGMTEIGAAVVDCQYGRPHPQEEDFIFEILKDDMKTEASPGEVGHLVVTTLKRRAIPVLRYLTGDRARLVKQNCQCGRQRQLEIRGRQEDTLMLGNRTLDIWDLQEIVSALPSRRFWVAGPGTKGLHLVLEEEKNSASPDSTLLQLLENRYNLKMVIETVPRGTLYDRAELLSLGVVGKPRYLYSRQEMQKKAYIHSTRL